MNAAAAQISHAEYLAPERFGHWLELVERLDGKAIDDEFDAPDLRRLLSDTIEQICSRGFLGGEPRWELVAQRALARIYAHYSRVPALGRAPTDSSYILQEISRRIERHFLAREERALGDPALDTLPINPGAYSSWLLKLLETHPASTHDLYESFLPASATREDLRYFLIQESTIDASTDDFLALVQVGAPLVPKLEMAANYWDEMGNGELSRVHGLLFSRSLAAFQIDPSEGVDEMEAEALACGNLQIMLSLQRSHFYKAVGYFAAVEYLAPRRFERLMSAWERNGLDYDASEYHRVHITVDVDHARTWLSNVVEPVIAVNPEAAPKSLVAPYTG